MSLEGQDKDADQVQLPLSSSTRNVRLESSSTVVAENLALSGARQESRLDLNDDLGNLNGRFDLRGMLYSRSARNQSLGGTIARADSFTKGGELTPDTCELACGLHFDCRPVFQGSLRGSSRSLRLERGSILAAECLHAPGKWREARLDLDRHLGNTNGHFDVRGRNFSKSACGQLLENTVLHAALFTSGGRILQGRLDLAEYIHNVNGHLLFGKLSSAWPDLRIKLCHSRCAFLVAKCRDDSGCYQESEINLNNWLGNTDGHFKIGGNNFASSARNIRLATSTVLCADLASRDGSWSRAMIDLGTYIDNKNGRLVSHLSDNNGPPCLRCEDCCSVARSIEDIESSSRAGCHICSTVSAAARIHKSRQSTPARCEQASGTSCAIYDDLHAITIFEWRQRSADFENSKVDHNVHKTAYRLFLIAGCPPVYPEFLWDMIVRTNHGIPHGPLESACQIRAKLQACIAAHRGCKVRTSPLPARVLDVGSLENPYLRLVDANTRVAHHAKYACLSHCWGKSPHLKLCAETSQQFLLEIAWDSLSRTFQDAIELCRHLSLKYLWIDALCILQHSREDWRKESAKMAEYYGNCHCCIAADWGSDGNAGLFMHDSPAPLQLLDEHGRNLNIFIEAAEHPDHVFPSLPLLTRAWAYQERLLSPRTIHFGNNKIWFECPESPERYRGSRYFEVFRRARSLDAGSWTVLAEHYSELLITFPNDRLLALSGLARAYANAAIDRGQPLGSYLAGLWESTLIQDLAWHTERIAERPPQYIAPSWSWVSTGTDVRCMSSWSSRINLCTVLSTKVRLASNANDFGALDYGSLTLRGRLTACGGWGQERTQRPPSWLDYDVTAPGPNQIPPDEELSHFALDIANDPGLSESTYSRHLVLRQHTQDDAVNTFERIGFALGCDHEHAPYKHVVDTEITIV